jgi:hypothetical protein
MGEVQQEQQHTENDGDEIESSSKSVDVSASILGKDQQEQKQQEDLNRRLTQREILNLTFALLAWACTICNITLSTFRNS